MSKILNDSNYNKLKTDLPDITIRTAAGNDTHNWYKFAQLGGDPKVDFGFSAVFYLTTLMRLGNQTFSRSDTGIFRLSVAGDASSIYNPTMAVDYMIGRNATPADLVTVYTPTIAMFYIKVPASCYYHLKVLDCIEEGAEFKKHIMLTSYILQDGESELPKYMANATASYTPFKSSIS